MRLVSPETKKIMEECKVRAEEAGLKIHGDTLEYIVTNQDLIELSPKIMIPTLYDYWVHDVQIIRGKWMYEVFPHNPYETVVNTRPAISFYNDNNPDWLNAMIFYHVLGHIDFFQNNLFFRNTWDDDFCGQALADKRLINRIREERGADKRWVDYVIEFSRGADNLVGYYQELEELERAQMRNVFGVFPERVDFYFDEFLSRLEKEKRVEPKFYFEEIDRYNACLKQFGQERIEEVFFGEPFFKGKFPEFNSIFEKSKKEKKVKTSDILQYLIERSEFLQKDANKWMKDVIGVVRKTSLYFQPQLRDHICNEGWASLWHEELFMTDKRIEGHRIDYALANAGVLVDPRLGPNVYAVGQHLYEFIKDMARRGKLSYAFQLIKNADERKRYDLQLGEEYGKKVLFEMRNNFNDRMLVNFLSDEDFQDFVNRYNLLVAGIRINPHKWGYADVYIKSRSGRDYRDMLNQYLYHPPHIAISEDKVKDGDLYLDHIFEGRSLVTEHIREVLTGLSYLWNGQVKLETTEFDIEKLSYYDMLRNPGARPKYKKLRVLYACKGKNISRTVLGEV